MNKKMMIKTAVALAMIAVVVPILMIGGLPLQILLAVIAALASYETASVQSLIRSARARRLRLCHNMDNPNNRGSSPRCVGEFQVK